MTKNKVGRNAPCPCGSGKKYKKCCLNKEDKESSVIFQGENQFDPDNIKLLDMNNKKLKNLIEEKTQGIGDGTYQIGVNLNVIGKNIITSDDIVIIYDGFEVGSAFFDEKRKLIEKIYSYDLKNIDISIIKKDFNELIEGEIKTQIPLAPKKLFRVRKNDIQHGFVLGFSNINELKYPPASFVKTMGRLNDVGESIFYASPCYETAVEECHIKDNDIFTLSEYELKNKTEPIPFWTLGINMEFFKLNFPCSEDTYENKCFIGELKSIEDNGIQKFLFDEITKVVAKDEEYNYKTTIALASIYLQRANTGIVYPSIACSHKSINIALPPNVFDDNLIATKCWLCKNMMEKFTF